MTSQIASKTAPMTISNDCLRRAVDGAFTLEFLLANPEIQKGTAFYYQGTHYRVTRASRDGINAAVSFHVGISEFSTVQDGTSVLDLLHKGDCYRLLNNLYVSSVHPGFLNYTRAEPFGLEEAISMADAVWLDKFQLMASMVDGVNALDYMHVEDGSLFVDKGNAAGSRFGSIRDMNEVVFGNDALDGFLHDQIRVESALVGYLESYKPESGQHTIRRIAGTALHGILGLYKRMASHRIGWLASLSPRYKSALSIGLDAASVAAFVSQPFFPVQGAAATSVLGILSTLYIMHAYDNLFGSLFCVMGRGVPNTGLGIIPFCTLTHAYVQSASKQKT